MWETAAGMDKGGRGAFTGPLVFLNYLWAPHTHTPHTQKPKHNPTHTHKRRKKQLVVWEPLKKKFV